METLFRVVVCSSPFPPIPLVRRSLLSNRNSSLAALKTSTQSPVSDVAEEEDLLQTFFKERQMSRDFVSRLSDVFWRREFNNSLIVDADEQSVVDSNASQQRGVAEDQARATCKVVDDAGGFLKLSATNEWVLGDRSAPANKKVIAKAMPNDSERRKKLSLLQYEAIQRELLLLSIGIGTACTGYCLIALSFQGAISYATGVLFSCLYLKLLYQHVDNLSQEVVPQIFRQRKLKKIGIRSQDLEDSLEKFIKGCGMALSSPRLVLPAAIYAVWILSHQFISSELFDFQLVPAMIGLFVYKVAALVQVYRDNEDLQLIFPDDL